MCLIKLLGLFLSVPLLGKKPTFCHISTAVAGSYRYPAPRVMVKVNLLGNQVGSSALMVFLQLYQKKVHSHAKMHVRMFSLHMNDIFLNLNFYFMLLICSKHTKTQCAKDIFLNLNFYVMLVNFAKHTNKQCAAQQNMPRVQTYVCFFFGASLARKFADKNEICGQVGRRTPTPQKGNR